MQEIGAPKRTNYANNKGNRWRYVRSQRQSKDGCHEGPYNARHDDSDACEWSSDKIANNQMQPTTAGATPDRLVAAR